MTTIAIIGTGNVGSAIGLQRREGRLRRRVRRPGRGQGADRGGGRRRQDCRRRARDAVAGADIIVLAVPYGAIAEIAAEIAPVAAGKIVIDPTNPLKADYSGLATGGGTSGAEELARLLPESKVVKAFNTVFAGNAANPQAHGFQLDSLFATDDEAAKDAVCGLSGSIGFRPIHVGPLAAARELEAMAWLNIRLQLISNGNWNTAYALVVPARGRA